MHDVRDLLHAYDCSGDRSSEDDDVYTSKTFFEEPSKGYRRLSHQSIKDVKVWDAQKGP